MPEGKTLLTADAVPTTDTQNRVIPEGGVLIEGTRIVVVDEAAALAAAQSDANIRRYGGAVLTPGLFARRAAYLAAARDNVQWTGL